MTHPNSHQHPPSIRVTKRDGRLEPIDLTKFHAVIAESAKGLQVSASQIEMKTAIQLYDGISTEEIQQAAIKSAADLISADTPDYQYSAARMNIYNLRKIAYGQFDPPDLYSHVTSMVERGLYDSEMITHYSKEEYDELNEYIDHSRDDTFSYAATKQLEGKYLVQDRTSKRVFESPQMMYIGISLCLFQHYAKETRLRYVKAFYDAISTFSISLPTPIMSGVRTPTRQFSSCVVMDCGDSLSSINATSSAIVRYVSQRAGIGVNVSEIRAIGSPIRGGEASHTGKIPFIRKFERDVKCCSQGGVRGGAATIYYPIWDYEVEELLVLKNNRGVEDNRARHLDYGVLLTGFFYQRMLEKKTISLFSTSEVPGLLKAFYEDQAEFKRLYELYEADLSIRRKTVPAMDLFATLISERSSTSRVYIAHVDHMNTNSPFDPRVAPIKQSNLCLEIALPTSPLDEDNREAGEIALCTLSAINVGVLNSFKELEELCDLTVRALDSLLDYQNYPVRAAQLASMYRRTLGIGVINFAYALAKLGLKYSDGSANNYTHLLFETLQFYLLKASMNLAKEVGPCPGFHETSYAAGVLPIDRYRKTVDAICNPEYQMDWEWLRGEIAQHGLRNSTLTALMPSETSSQISNATNGIEPPRGLVSVKSSKDGVLRQVVPGIETLRHAYELYWDANNAGYLRLVAIMQKFVDQSISANTRYDPSRFPGGKVPSSEILTDLITAYNYGIKTLYYHNTRDNAGSSTKVHDFISNPNFVSTSTPTPTEVIEVEDDSCAGGACKI